MAKMSKKWIALCSAALGVIYATEYFVTETNASTQSSPQYSQISTQTESTPIPSTPAPSIPATNTPTPSTSIPSTPASNTPTTSTPTPSTPTPKPTPVPSTPKPTSTPTPTQAPTSTPTQAPTPAPAPTKAPSLYKEGTFTGSGSNRRGSIEVTVTIKNDKITDVEISDFAMHYSINDVVGLPDEALQNQSAHVDNVSGATYSTRAFEDAMQDALSQAQNT
jgi:uncharacterized protein with FMN-binding domain